MKKKKEKEKEENSFLNCEKKKALGTSKCNMNYGTT